MPIAWSNVENAVQALIAGATSLPGTSVYWVNQLPPKQPRPFATLNIISLKRRGLFDEQRTSSPVTDERGWLGTTTYQPNIEILVGSNIWWTQLGGTTSGSQPGGLSASSPADGTIVSNDGTVTWQLIQASDGAGISTFGLREFVVSVNIHSSALTGSGTARDYASQLLDGLSRQDLADALALTGVAILFDGGVRDLSALVETAYESRTQLDITFGVSSQTVLRYPTIDSIQLINTVPPAPTTTVIEQPLTISPSSANVGYGYAGTQQFTATGGSGTGYVWSITNNSAGTINSSGLVTAAVDSGGGGITDTVTVTDGAGNTATATVITYGSGGGA